jgi:predicted RNase H-like HicB family nuclease
MRRLRRGAMIMTKLLVIVERKGGGFRGFVPRLPGCETFAATEQQAEADILVAARARLAANEERTNGIRPDMEIVVVVQPPPLPPRQVGDGLDDFYNAQPHELSDQQLEMLLNWEEQEGGSEDAFEALIDEFEKSVTTRETLP